MKTVRVVAAIIIENDKVFATQRGYGEFKDGWEFPGGKIEPGETPEEAIVREIKEELDTEVEVIELLDTVEYDYPNFHLSMGGFICKIKSGDLVLKEHEAAKWLTKDTLGSVEWLPADMGLVREIEKIFEGRLTCLKLQKVTLKIKHMGTKVICLIGQCFIFWEMESKLILESQIM